MSDPGPGDEQSEPLTPDESAEGVELTMSAESNSFEPEEDPEAAPPEAAPSQD